MVSKWLKTRALYSSDAQLQEEKTAAQQEEYTDPLILKLISESICRESANENAIDKYESHTILIDIDDIQTVNAATYRNAECSTIVFKNSDNSRVVLMKTQDIFDRLIEREVYVENAMVSTIKKVQKLVLKTT